MTLVVKLSALQSWFVPWVMVCTAKALRTPVPSAGATGQARRFFCWSVAILEESPKITTEPSPEGRLLLQIVYHSFDSVFHQCYVQVGTSFSISVSPILGCCTRLRSRFFYLSQRRQDAKNFWDTDFQDYTDLSGFFLELMVINSRKEIIPSGYFNRAPCHEMADCFSFAAACRSEV